MLKLMKRFYHFIVLFFFLENILSCAQSRNVSLNSLRTATSENEQKIAQKPILDYSDINPEDIRVIARLLSVLPPDAHAAFPCNQFPCLGEVEIIDVVGKGRTYHGTIKKGERLQVFFSVTLMPTSAVFKDGPVIYHPGLAVGQMFKADMSGGGQAIDPGAESYLINRYQIVEE